ncbi:MAG: HAMP domain-containing histidine kinase [Rhodospirillaceae bacterium]|nr:HAMP domain-containing histidine kinase [Rhodospirillaceae bacterium]
MIDGALVMAIAIAAVLGWVLVRRAHGDAEPASLGRFLIGVALGVAGLALAQHPQARWLGELLMLTAPATAAALLDLIEVIRADGRRPARGAIRTAAHAAAVLAATAGLARLALVPWAETQYGPPASGWPVILATGAIASVAFARLAGHAAAAAGEQRRRALLLLAACLVGLATCGGTVTSLVGLRPVPQTLVLMPAFLLLLVYGVLRYGVGSRDPWVRRFVAVAVLALATTAAAAGLAVIGLAVLGTAGSGGDWPALVVAVLSATAVAALAGSRIERALFPGAVVDEARLAAWRERLTAAADREALSGMAGEILKQALGTAVPLVMAPAVPPAGPAVVLHRRGRAWTPHLQGWQAAPAGHRHTALIVGELATEAAAALDRLAEAEAAAEERARTAHLAELGLLTATVAHDLRNPMNTLAMAAAACDAQTRAEIRQQLGRMEALVADLLDYAAAWRVEAEPVALAEAIVPTGRVPVDCRIPAGLSVRADPRGLARVFANLLANADAAVRRAGGDGRIAVAAERAADGSLLVHIRDQGDGVPAVLRGRLFQPFASRDRQGTGLGLAIAARIMQAHGGAIRLTDDPGWATTMTLVFPGYRVIGDTP